MTQQQRLWDQSNLVYAPPVHPGRDGRPINLFGGLISATWLYGLNDVQIVRA